MKRKICILTGILLIFIATVICLFFSLNKNEENQEQIENISTIKSQAQEDNQKGDDAENEVNENQESEVENIPQNAELPKQEKTTEKNITIKKTSNNEKNTTENNNLENKNSPKVLNNNNISTSTKNDKTDVTEDKNKQATSKKIDLSKYDYYEKNANGSYKGFIEDSSEINKLKSLINENLKSFGYKDVKVAIDKSLSRDGTPYFTANNTNVKNLVYDCEGFSIHYYAVKEYSILTEGKESYIQTRSYIKVK